jgi:hypothetical protein
VKTYIGDGVILDIATFLLEKNEKNGRWIISNNYSRTVIKKNWRDGFPSRGRTRERHGTKT